MNSVIAFPRLLYRQRDIGYLQQVLADVTAWMKRHGFGGVDEFRGKLSQVNSADPTAYERVQFVLQTSGRPLD